MYDIEKRWTQGISLHPPLFVVSKLYASAFEHSLPRIEKRFPRWKPFNLAFDYMLSNVFVF